MADANLAEFNTPELEGRSAPSSTPLKASPPSQGHHFLDLLALGALACNAPIALLSVHNPATGWNTLGYGLRSPVGTRIDVDELVRRFPVHSGPIELEDMLTTVPGSPLLQAPFSLRWAYGSAIAGPDGQRLGVVVILDRWAHRVTKREHRILGALVRQLALALGEVKGVSVAPATPTPARARVSRSSSEGALLRSPEVAALFNVSERTVLNWAHSGKLPCLRTIGGHLRFRREDVMQLLDNT